MSLIKQPVATCKRSEAKERGGNKAFQRRSRAAKELREKIGRNKNQDADRWRFTYSLAFRGVWHLMGEEIGWQ